MDNVVAAAEYGEDSDPAGVDNVKVQNRDGTTWVGSGGTTYDAYIFLDHSENVSNEKDWNYKEFPLQYTQDGDVTITTAASDYTQIQ